MAQTPYLVLVAADTASETRSHIRRMFDMGHVALSLDQILQPLSADQRSGLGLEELISELSLRCDAAVVSGNSRSADLVRARFSDLKREIILIPEQMPPSRPRSQPKSFRLLDILSLGRFVSR
jgi:hypothetical protein